MSEISLRPYQQTFIDNVREEFMHGSKRVCGVAPCGAGKTIMTGWMIRQSFQRNKSSVFFVHRKELIEQTSDTFHRLGIPHGIICAGFKPNYSYPVQIASVQTLIKRLDKIHPPDFLICDECHHILADTYQDIINFWSDAFLLGVTATPQRTGGVRLGDVFQSMVQAPSVAALIKLGNLTDFHYFALDLDIDSILESLKISHGDYDNYELERLMSAEIIVHNIVDNYKLHSDGKSAICYCVNVNHSKCVADSFADAGIPVAHCDGNTPKPERAAIIDNFRRGNIKVLCNAELFGEGFDVPNCHTVILARPTKSLTLFIQQSMRSMRPDPDDPNKVAIILDCVGNHKRHGMPDDNRNWSLDPNKPKTKKDGVKKSLSEINDDYITCPVCQKDFSPNLRVCPNCGYIFDSKEIDAELDLIHNSENEVLGVTPGGGKILRAPRTIEEFLDYAADHNYKKGWAVIKALDFVQSYSDLLHIAKVMNYKNGWAYHKAQDLGIPITRSGKNGLQKALSSVKI